MYVDLHIHTNNSDGQYSIEDILKKCEKAKLKIISITDHDSVQSYIKMSNNNFEQLYSGEIITCIELSFRYHGRLLDILGYGIDINIINEWLTKQYTKENQIIKQSQILKKMIHLYKKLGFIFNENFSISTGLKSEAYNKVILAIKSNKDNLKLENDLNKPNFYKKHHTNPKSKYYIDETFGLPTLEESIDLIHSAGGIAILAHSCAYGFQTNELENFITFAIKSGIDGLELKYPTHTYSDEEKIKKYCEKFKLLTTCGSDYHGDKIKQGINLGKGHKNYRFKDSDIVEILAKLKNK